MSTESTRKPKARRKPGRSKGGRSAGRSPAKTRPPKAAAGGPKAAPTRTKTAGGGRRLRPGELDGLVLAHLRGHEDALPLGPGAVAKGITRSSGAVGNCLERLAGAEDSPVRRVRERPRAYDLGAGTTA